MKNQRICIIGGGLAGLTTAMVLKNLNLDIDILYKEKYTNIELFRHMKEIEEKHILDIINLSLVKLTKRVMTLKKGDLITINNYINNLIKIQISKLIYH